MKPMRPATLGVALALALALVGSGPVVAQSKCQDCGTVQSVREVKQKGQGTGLGAVGGAVVGGVLGHQIGGGTGKTVATIAGAGGGAYAGHQVEKNVKSKTTWVVDVRMDSGQLRTLSYGSAPTVREGERVKLLDGGKRLALLAK